MSLPDKDMIDSRYLEQLGLGEIGRKVAQGERLTISDGEKLFACPDMNVLGSLAHQVRTRLHGNAAYYVVNRQINYSNICVNGCRFCAFSKKKGDPLAFELSEDEIPGLIKNLEEVLTYAARVQEIASGAEESSSKNVNVFREDVIMTTDPKSILANAPKREENYFVVPVVLE